MENDLLSRSPFLLFLKKTKYVAKGVFHVLKTIDFISNSNLQSADFSVDMKRRRRESFHDFMKEPKRRNMKRRGKGDEEEGVRRGRDERRNKAETGIVLPVAFFPTSASFAQCQNASG